MKHPHRAPYGSWRSPISAQLAAMSGATLEEVMLDGDTLYWIERRPLEGGRNAIVRRAPDGTLSEALPTPYNARTRVHEYGGGSYTVSDGIIYFSNFADQQLYRLTPGATPEAITHDTSMRYADGMVDRQRQRLICVGEEHAQEQQEPLNTLIGVALDGSGKRDTLAAGADFYASPRVSPDGKRLAWLTWNHPNMPWNGTELWVGEFDAAGMIVHAARMAGGVDESIFQPEWSPDGVLHFASDRTGWWNLYALIDGKQAPLCERAAEFGVAQWRFGLSCYAFAGPTTIICSVMDHGVASLARLETTNGALTTLQGGYSRIEWVRATPETSIFIYDAPTEPQTLARLDLATGQAEPLRRASELAVSADYLSIPQPIEFPTTGGKTAYALYYAPKNPDYVASADTKPPLLVTSHGGPTGQAFSKLDLSIQYWTSRGIAVLDVNYGGSTGYGREYRRRLEGQWGIVDVEDCVNGARYLVEQGMVDGARLMIRGGSASGFTTLCALTFYDVFKAGTSYFGISDLEALARDTHKFESRYPVRLVGPYPERRDIYYQRSPIHFVERLSCPMIFFQGLEDRVVPPNQTELMVEALRARGLPVAYVTFANEQHGFRRAENVQRALEAELYFYAQTLGFPLADQIEPVAIE